MTKSLVVGKCDLNDAHRLMKPLYYAIMKWDARLINFLIKLG